MKVDFENMKLTISGDVYNNMFTGQVIKWNNNGDCTMNEFVENCSVKYLKISTGVNILNYIKK